MDIIASIQESDRLRPLSFLIVFVFGTLFWFTVASYIFKQDLVGNLYKTADLDNSLVRFVLDVSLFAIGFYLLPKFERTKYALWYALVLFASLLLVKSNLSLITYLGYVIYALVVEYDEAFSSSV